MIEDIPKFYYSYW